MKTARTTFLGMALAILICTTGGLVYAATVLKHETPQHETPPAFAPDQVIVAFKPGTPAEAKRAAHAQAGGRVIRALKGIGADLVGIPSNKVMDKIAVYKRNPNVRYAEPNYYRTLTVPSEGLDPYVCNGNYFDEQWYLHNTGQSFLNDIYTGPCALTGALDADIDWLEAYEAGKTGRSSIKIAMVDSGVEWTHPDLVSKIVETWAAPGVIIAGEGPEDIIGHGTHVAGIAVAETNNGSGIAGVGGDTSIGSLKVCKCTSIFCLTHTCEDADIVEAIFHAINNGYHIINMSLGGPAVGQAVQDAVDAAFQAGLILVAGAGNNYQLNPPNQFYPANCEGVISVAATDHFDNIASFSNFGPGVDVAAPGTSILSTYPGAACSDSDCYNWLSGTSMATPVVAGVAALVLDSIGGDPIVRTPSLRDDVINAILNNADHTGALGQNMLAWTQHGRLNLQAALTGGGENIPPVAAFTYSCNGLTCDFDASDSNDPDGSIVSYAWNFGDSNTGSGMTTIHIYSAGTYDVILTVRDDDGATDNNSQSVTVSETLDNLHVGDLDDSSTSQSLTWWTASVTVMVHDGDHNAVEGAMVSGTWSGGASGTATGTTNPGGLCTFSYPNIHKKNPIVTLTVDNITKNSVLYDPNKNHDPEEDSDGNSITVLKP